MTIINYRYKKSLLVRLSYSDYLGNNLTPHLGLGYIGEALEEIGVAYKCYDMGLSSFGFREYGEKELMEMIEDYSPDMIGITMQTYQYKIHYNLMFRIKRKFPKIEIILGGSHLSSYKKSVLEECQAIDFGVVKEGEETIVELSKGNDVRNIGGLIYREEGEVIENPERKRVRHPDEITWPKYRNFELDRYAPETIGIVTSRGCPYKCTYCSVALSIGRETFFRTADNIIEEISYWYDQGKRMINIYDDNFTLRKNRIVELCEKLKKKNFHDLKFSLPNGVRADKLNDELLVMLRDVGLSMIAIGVESANDEILDLMKKSEHMDEIDKAVKSATDLGINVYLFFIVGLPGETEKQVNKSFKFAEKYPVKEAAFFNPIPYPETKLFNQVEEKGRFLKSPEEYLNETTYNMNDPAFETPELSRQDRKDLFIKANKVRKQIKVRAKMQKVKRFKPLFLPLAHIAASQAYIRLLHENRFLYNMMKIFKDITGFQTPKTVD